ncbi:MAG: hypothetical protein J3Q66DRAFT_340150 [Benniella sp.]|nr:MAG: hypothetical protein J3Q66DRAFT_340150 [Benniella sp.]
MRFHLIALALTLLIGALSTVNALTIPFPRPLSFLGVNDGSVVALKNNLPGAKHQGYLSQCDGCPEKPSQLATNDGNSNGNPWSQFRIEFVTNDKNGYQLVRLKNIWSDKYLAVDKKPRDGQDVATFEWAACSPRTGWWALVVVRDGKPYLALMSDYLKGRAVKLCKSCWKKEDKDYLVISKDRKENWKSYHLYTVEIIKP